MDPAKNDVPVETVLQNFAPGADNPAIESERHIVYSDFSKAANGIWYPSAWKFTSTMQGRNGQTVSVSNSRLQIWTGQKLGAEWFQDPEKKVAGQ
jgi:hypothetical protein